MGDEIKNIFSWIITVILGFILWIILIILEYLVLAFSICKIPIFRTANTQELTSKLIIYCQDTTSPGILTKIILPLLAIYLTYIIIRKIKKKS